MNATLRAGALMDAGNGRRAGTPRHPPPSGLA
jgi:hypothetical protein